MSEDQKPIENKEEQELKEKLYKEHMAKKLLNQDMISKKVAALECYKVERKLHNVAFFGVLSAPFLVILNRFGIMWSAVGAVSISCGLAYFMFKAKLRMQELNMRYDLKIPKGFYGINKMDQQNG